MVCAHPLTSPRSPHSHCAGLLVICGIAQEVRAPACHPKKMRHALRVLYLDSGTLFRFWNKIRIFACGTRLGDRL